MSRSGNHMDWAGPTVAGFANLPHIRRVTDKYAEWTRSDEGMLTMLSLQGLILSKSLRQIAPTNYKTKVADLRPASIPLHDFMIIVKCCEALFEAFVKREGQLGQLRHRP